MLVRYQFILRWKVDAGIAWVTYRGICNYKAYPFCPCHPKRSDYFSRACASYDAVVYDNNVLVFNYFRDRDYTLVYLESVVLIWLDKAAHRAFLAVPVL